MPYVDVSTRSKVSKELDALTKKLEKLIGENPDNRDGIMNYVVSSLIARLYPEATSRYRDYNAATGMLECAKLELYRRLVAPYEDTKIAQHGDVYRTWSSSK
jgi:hypothetical protein